MVASVQNWTQLQKKQSPYLAQGSSNAIQTNGCEL